MKITLILLMLILSGCATTQTITTPDAIYSAKVSSGTSVTIQTGEHKRIVFDRTGRPSIVEGLVTIMGLKVVNSD